MGLPDRSEDCVELAFGLHGSSLPTVHRRALADAVLSVLPWLADEPAAGLHCQHLVDNPQGDPLVSGRTRLVLRLPRTRVTAARALEGTTLRLGPALVGINAGARLRELLPWSTLYAASVASPQPAETDFLADVSQALLALGITARPLCGRHRPLTDAGAPWLGYSLMLDGLSTDHARLLMRHGLGPHRLWGCGVFIPHKSAAAVGH